MLNNYLKKGLLLAGLCLSAQFTNAQDLIHYWNFNDNTTVVTLATPTQTIGGATITAFTGTASELAIGTGQNFDVLNLNAQNGDAAGTHLRFNNPIGGSLEFALPTVGYENIIVKFATKRSGSGAGTQTWSYSTDGITYTVLTTVTPVDGDPELATLDLSDIEAADNNANLKLKVEFTEAPGGAAGNNRFDNFTVNGTALITSTLIHYWNFNDNATVVTLATPTQTIGGATITAFTGTASELAIGTGQSFDVLNINAQNGDAAGTHLRFNNPIGGSLEFALPTIGYENIIVKFATKRSGSGAGTQTWSYSTDGITYTVLTTVTPVDGDPELATLRSF